MKMGGTQRVPKGMMGRSCQRLVAGSATSGVGQPRGTREVTGPIDLAAGREVWNLSTNQPSLPTHRK